MYIKHQMSIRCTNAKSVTEDKVCELCGEPVFGPSDDTSIVLLRPCGCAFHAGCFESDEYTSCPFCGSEFDLCEIDLSQFTGADWPETLRRIEELCGAINVTVNHRDETLQVALGTLATFQDLFDCLVDKLKLDHDTCKVSAQSPAPKKPDSPLYTPPPEPPYVYRGSEAHLPLQEPSKEFDPKQSLSILIREKLATPIFNVATARSVAVRDRFGRTSTVPYFSDESIATLKRRAFLALSGLPPAVKKELSEDWAKYRRDSILIGFNEDQILLTKEQLSILEPRQLLLSLESGTRRLTYDYEHFGTEEYKTDIIGSREHVYDYAIDTDAGLTVDDTVRFLERLSRKVSDARSLPLSFSLHQIKQQSEDPAPKTSSGPAVTAAGTAPAVTGADTSAALSIPSYPSFDFSEKQKQVFLLASSSPRTKQQLKEATRYYDFIAEQRRVEQIKQDNFFLLLPSTLDTFKRLSRTCDRFGDSLIALDGLILFSDEFLPIRKQLSRNVKASIVGRLKGGVAHLVERYRPTRPPKGPPGPPRSYPPKFEFESLGTNSTIKPIQKLEEASSTHRLTMVDNGLALVTAQIDFSNLSTPDWDKLVSICDIKTYRSAPISQIKQLIKEIASQLLVDLTSLGLITRRADPTIELKPPTPGSYYDEQILGPHKREHPISEDELIGMYNVNSLGERNFTISKPALFDVTYEDA
jgi:hypothetical protein